MTRRTKAELVAANEALAAENFALRLPMEFNLDVEAHRVGEVRHPDGALTEVFYFLSWRFDGGCIWMKEHLPQGAAEHARRQPSRAPSFMLTAMDCSEFNRFVERRVSAGSCEWRDVQQLVQTKERDALNATVVDGSQ